MSRIGKRTIKVPAGVTIETANGELVVKGAKATLRRKLHTIINIAVVDGVASVSLNKETEDKKESALWGTFASHLKNMVEGVTTGFKKELEINGVGYKVAMQGKDLKIEAGYSHPVIFKMPEGVTATVDKNVISLESADKELLGSTATEIRSIRKPEPYKGKGIKLMTEQIRRKAGKSAKAGA